jgi:hypothetical protein
MSSNFIFFSDDSWPSGPVLTVARRSPRARSSERLQRLQPAFGQTWPAVFGVEIRPHMHTVLCEVQQK